MAKIPVAILGATGPVGQQFVHRLNGHPWFEIVAVAASEMSSGKRYVDACRRIIFGDLPPDVGGLTVRPLEPNLPGRLVFSALPSNVAGDIEPVFAQAGYIVCSNASAFRYEMDVPLVIPEVNADHVVLVEKQRAKRGWSGFIVTSPNCTTTGIAMPLKPLDDAFGLERVFAFTMQAVSGAGYPGTASLDILDNVLPYIPGEEGKIERETRMLLGNIVDHQRIDASFVVSSQANRVPVVDGHTICLSLGFASRPTIEQATVALTAFRGSRLSRVLPSAPEKPVLVRTEIDRPQPRQDCNAEASMAVTVGRLRSCPILDLRMVTVVHNTVRGAASGSILNAELLVSKDLVT